MGMITYDMETRSSVPVAKMFKALVLDSDTLIPKIMPQAIKNVEILEGDGGVGTVKIIHFSRDSQFKNVKHRVDAVDTESLSHIYSILEGDALMGDIESITYHVKIVPTEDGGCVCKNTSIYHTKEGVEIDKEGVEIDEDNVEIDEDKIKEGKEKAMVMFKAIEAYLQANPDA